MKKYCGQPNNRTTPHLRQPNTTSDAPHRGNVDWPPARAPALHFFSHSLPLLRLPPYLPPPTSPFGSLIILSLDSVCLLPAVFSSLVSSICTSSTHTHTHSHHKTHTKHAKHTHTHTPASSPPRAAYPGRAKWGRPAVPLLRFGLTERVETHS